MPLADRAAHKDEQQLGRDKCNGLSVAPKSLLRDNPNENAVRPIVLGRKNWLFAGSEHAGQGAAAIMSLVTMATADGIDPFAYLKDVLTRLPTHKDAAIDELLPQNFIETELGGHGRTLNCTRVV